MVSPSETFISLKDAAHSFPGNMSVCYETVRRWATDGIRGIRLETVRIGGRRKTTREACQRFIERLTETDNPQDAPESRELRAQLARERMRIKHGR